MNAYFDFEDFEGIMELNKENLEKAEKIVEKWSGEYCNYILAIDWDYENNIPYIYQNGPWEY